MKHRLCSASLATLAALALAACAVTPAAPTAQLAASHTALDQARMSGAPTTATVEYDTAQSKLARAQAAFDAQDYTTATRLAREAEVDAQLAQARTQAMNAQQALAEIEQSIRDLQIEIDRATRGG